MRTKNINAVLTKDNRFSVKSEFLRRFFVLGIKISFVLVLLVLLYSQVFVRKDMNLSALLLQLQGRLSYQTLPVLLLVLLLMPLNWLLEVQKWRSLMPKHPDLSMLNALKAVLAGLAVSLFTPNRIGEYGGRVLLVAKPLRIQTVWATVIGSLSQWIVLIVGGWWALVLALHFGLIDVKPVVVYWLIGLGSLLTVTALFFYLNLALIITYFGRFRWTKNLVQRCCKAINTRYTRPELIVALLFSLARYTTYSLQYLLLLIFFGFDADVFVMLLCVLIVYFLQTGIPLPPSTGLLARGNIALMVFGGLSTTAGVSIIILASTFGLWIINVVFPSLIGGLFLMKSNIGLASHKSKDRIEPTVSVVSKH